jgi:predicted PurR-regulated permease PerM
VIEASFKTRTSEELIALLSAVAIAVLAFIISRHCILAIFVPISLAILLSFVLAPLVESLERIRVPREIAVVGVVIFAFAAIFATGSPVGGSAYATSGRSRALGGFESTRPAAKYRGQPNAISPVG